MTMYGVRLDYHCGRIERPLIECVLPMLDARPGLALSARVHWSGGHHLILRHRTMEAAADTARQLERWVIGAPSATTLDAVEFARFATDQARAEGLCGDPMPVRANNHVAIEPFEEDAYLGSPLIALARIWFEEATVRPLLHLRAGDHRAMMMRMQLLLAEVACCYRDGGAANGVRSLRAHARNFLAAHPALEPRFEQAYAAASPRIAPEIAALLAGRQPADALHDALIEAGEQLDLLGADPALLPGAGVHRLATADEAGQYPVPPSLARWLSSDVINGAPDKQNAFGRHRTLINFVYAQCPLLGIAPITRFACAYIAYRALADAMGLSDTALEPVRKVA